MGIQRNRLQISQVGVLSINLLMLQLTIRLLDEEELVSIATLKQMLDVQQSMIKTLFDSLSPLSMQESISWQTQSRLSKQALSSHKRMSKICRP